jgi:glutaredoxin
MVFGPLAAGANFVARAGSPALARPGRLRYPAAVLRDLFRKAQEAAERHLPESVRETGRKLAEQVQGRAPASLQRLARSLLDAAREPDEAGADGGAEPLDRRDPIVVVLFGYPDDAATDRVAALLAAEGVAFRRMNLHDQPQAARQIAAVTGVMAPPYVYVRGRFWGGEGEMEGLRALGELQHVVTGELERLSDEARRIGKLREEFNDALTADNILLRLRKGHILTIDDLDCWYEPGPDGQGRFFYEGGPRPVDDMPAVAAEIAGRSADADLRATWRFEPAVTI